MDARHFFTDSEKALILNAICEAENETSGEIRVHVSEHCPSGELDAAAYWFDKLLMHKTKERNGVLFYLAIKDRRFAIIGDAGINSRVPTDFWDSISALIQSRFVEGRFADGLAEGIRMAGVQLKEHFPRQADDVNELPDEISFS